MKIRYVSIFLLLAGILWFLPQQLSARWTPKSSHQWPMFHGNYNHTGYVKVKGPHQGKLKWKLQAASGEEGTPPPNSVAIAADGTLFLGSPEKVYAIGKNGKKKWSKEYKNVQGPALSDDGKTLYFAGDNALYALSTKNGKKQWKVSMGNSTLFGPTIAPDGTIYQGSWDGYLYAVKANGKLKWKYKTGGALSYPVSVNKNGTIFFGGGDAHAGPDAYVYSLSKAGKLKWKYDTGSTRSGSPAIGADGLIYLPSAPTLFVLSADGKLKWKMGPGGGGDDPEDMRIQDEPIGEDEEDIGDGSGDKGDVAGIITPAIASDGTVYIGNSQGLITAINPKTQSAKWTYQTGVDPEKSDFYGLPSFPVVDKDGVLYIGSVDHYMYALDKSGNLLWKYETGGRISEAAPALASDGTLYFTSEDGYLYAVKD